MKHILTALLLVLLVAPAHAQSSAIMIGETAVLTNLDNGNGNLLLAQKVTLSQSATIQSLSFYVKGKAGNLLLGIYSNGPNNNPAKLMAATAPFATVAGWNIQPVITHVTLAAGTYWLVYLPSSNLLSFEKQNNSGACFLNGRAFSAGLPANFPTSASSCTPTTWSFYATLLTGSPPPAPTLSLSFSPATLGSDGMWHSNTKPNDAPAGTPIASIIPAWSNGQAFTGTLRFAAPNNDDNGLFAISSTACGALKPPCVILNRAGPATQSTQYLSIEAQQ
jgi:hypothetical protein